MFTADHPLDVVPFLGLVAESSVDGRLKISAALPTDWLMQNLEADLEFTKSLQAPWLTRLGIASRPLPWAIYALPSAPGVTLSSLWRRLEDDQRGWLGVTLLRTMLRAWPVAMFPRSGVLCDTNGLLWLVPPFRTCVESASKTWDPWHFEEYAIGGFNSHATHGLAITLSRLVLEVPLTELYAMRTSPTPVPSKRLAWLHPLDALVAEAFDELIAGRPAAAGAAQRWASSLAVLEDHCQQTSVLSLGALVSRAWPTTSPRHRWGDGRGP